MGIFWLLSAIAVGLILAAGILISFIGFSLGIKNDLDDDPFDIGGDGA